VNALFGPGSGDCDACGPCGACDASGACGAYDACDACDACAACGACGCCGACGACGQRPNQAQPPLNLQTPVLSAFKGSQPANPPTFQPSNLPTCQPTISQLYPNGIPNLPPWHSAPTVVSFTHWPAPAALPAPAHPEPLGTSPPKPSQTSARHRTYPIHRPPPRPEHFNNLSPPLPPRRASSSLNWSKSGAKVVDTYHHPNLQTFKPLSW